MLEWVESGWTEECFPPRERKGHKTVNRNKPNKPIDERENGRELATGYGRWPNKDKNKRETEWDGEKKDRKVEESDESRLTQSYICVILLKMTGRKAALLLFSVSLLIKSVHTPVTKNETSTLFRRRSNNQRDKLTLRRCWPSTQPSLAQTQVALWHSYPWQTTSHQAQSPAWWW